MKLMPWKWEENKTFSGHMWAFVQSALLKQPFSNIYLCQCLKNSLACSFREPPSKTHNTVQPLFCLMSHMMNRAERYSFHLQISKQTYMEAKCFLQGTRQPSKCGSRICPKQWYFQQSSHWGSCFSDVSLSQGAHRYKFKRMKNSSMWYSSDCFVIGTAMVSDKPRI